MKTRVIWTKNEVFGHVPKLPLLFELITMPPPSYVEVEVMRRGGLLTSGIGSYPLATAYESF